MAFQPALSSLDSAEISAGTVCTSADVYLELLEQNLDFLDGSAMQVDLLQDGEKVFLLTWQPGSDHVIFKIPSSFVNIALQYLFVNEVGTLMSSLNCPIQLVVTE